VFEVSDTNPENNRSMFGGGRYDGLVGQFGVEPVATVGFGMGDVTLQNFLEVHGLLPELPSETDVYLTLVGQDMYAQVQPLLKRLRDEDIRVAVDATNRRIDKQIKAAVKKNIRWLIVVGGNELATQRFALKNLQTGDSEEHGIERIVSLVKDYRRRTGADEADLSASV